ncbi:MAG TPA: CheR family methyltransferase [Gammaproteobacteria bacterium]|nr:CheR family methyltransferase [Gammaproteobacteria bacterium]
MDAETTRPAPFPIVGLGASAGGLDALRRFFEAMPPDCGMAFIVVTHLDPERESHLAPILERFTSMPVVVAKDGMRVQPAMVYVRPSDAVLSLRDGIMRLSSANSRPARYMPINLFFHSLAEEHGEHAVCIILSGTGTDGTMGLRAIKEHGGMCIAQGDGSVEHSGMRISAIATGLVDFVLEPADMPVCLIEYAQHIEELRKAKLEGKLTDGDRRQLDRILDRLHKSTGYDLRQYKKSTVMRRVRRRMHVVKLREPEDYVALLERGDGEAQLLFRDLLIGVTQFFRGQETFDTLARDVVSAICDRKEPGESVRVWVPGCSTGEEAYSLAILFAAQTDCRSAVPKIQVFGTDIDESALVTARTGIYSKGIEHDISPELLARYFRRTDDRYIVTDELREMCVFSSHDLIQDPPFSKLDLISCRNLFIYFESVLQKRLFPLLHFALKPGGILVLGKSETAQGFDHLFAPLNKAQRIFQRKEPAARPTLDFPTGRGRRPALPARPASPQQSPPLRRLAEKYLLEHLAPACVVVDSGYQCIFFAGPTSEFLQPSGAPSLNLLNMAKPGLRSKLLSALDDVMRTGRPVKREFRISRSEVEQALRVRVRPLPSRKGQDVHYLVTIEKTEDGDARSSVIDPALEPSSGGEGNAVIARLEEELDFLRFELRASTEDLETANEELQSSNEELMSSNEELQALVEEMETSKEELQSINDELESVNARLNDTVEELANANDDLANLHASTHLPVIFVDRQLRVRMFTPAATELFHLIPDDSGRSILDIARRHDYAGFQAELERVLHDGECIEKEVVADAGRIYRSRLAPYRAAAGELRGVVATFVDVTDIRRLQRDAEARASQQLTVAQIGLYALAEKDLSLVMHRAVHDARHILAADCCAVFVPDQAESSGVALLAGEGWSEVPAAAAPVAGDFARRVLAGPGQVVTADMGATTGTAAVDVPDRMPASAAGVAIRIGEECFGVLAVFSAGQRDFSAQDVSFCQAVANVLASAVQRARGEAELIENQRRLADAETQDKLQRAERLASLGTLAGGIAHEINNPLNAIWMTAELAKQGLSAGRDAARLSELLDRIVAECRRSAAITRGVLSFASRDGKLPGTTVNINATARTLPDLLHRKLERHGAALVLDLDEGLPEIEAHPIEIERILSNLVQNAAEQGAKRITVETAAADEGAGIRIRVMDDGPGIPPAIMQRIFDPFFSTRRAAGGTGLGLSLVHRFVDNLGGMVSAANRPAGGAEFVIDLPGAQAAPAAEPALRRPAG